MGLGQYGVLSRNWLHSGQTLVLATPQELEKVLGCTLTHTRLTQQAGKFSDTDEASNTSQALSKGGAFSHAAALRM